MSYETIEDSVKLGRPFFLYSFDDGTTITRLTSEPEAIVWLTNTYNPSPISHADIEQSGNIEKASLDLTFPLSDTFARRFLSPIAQVVTVTIWRGHHGDETETRRVIWKGRVVGAKSRGQLLTVEVESVYTSLRRPGCRARYQRTCRFALYQDGCNLDVDDFKVAGTLTAMNGLVLTVTEAALAAAGDYKAGMLIYEGTFGFIIAHSGTSLTLLSAVPGLQDAFDLGGPLDVFIAPGCDLSRTRCETRFANELNHGAFPYMPDNNPFSTSII